MLLRKISHYSQRLVIDDELVGATEVAKTRPTTLQTQSSEEQRCCMSAALSKLSLVPSRGKADLACGVPALASEDSNLAERADVDYTPEREIEF